jgi:hypothetical protein
VAAFLPNVGVIGLKCGFDGMNKVFEVRLRCNYLKQNGKFFRFSLIVSKGIFASQ